MTIHHDEDAECMTRVAMGDGAALKVLYERHGRALLRFSAAMCRSRQAAEDLLHDTFVDLLGEAGHYDAAQGTVFAYLCGVLRHRVSHHHRREKRWLPLGEDHLETRPHEAESPSDTIARSENTAAFRRVMLELPGPHREIIALCDLEELPYSTVAAVLDCPIGTVRSRLHRARALLTIRLASLEMIELQTDLPLAERSLT
jgi:RNA polymerase sigma-70 factor (ECF subfamily)